jgi:arginyl-tRNA synthetase
MASSTTSKTLSLSSLQALLSQLGAPIPLPSFPNADPVSNPNDIYRLYIADALEKLIDCDRDLVYESLQRTSTPSKGDLVLVLPRLRLKGVKLSELGAELASKVIVQLIANICTVFLVPGCLIFV